jgi:hypothetical protein
MLELRCPAHPTYRAIRKQRVECADCAELWRRHHEPTLWERFKAWVLA